MKKIKIITMIITISVLFCALMIPSFAQSLSAKDEQDNILDYYSKNLTEIKTPEQIILFGSSNAISGSNVPDVWDSSLSDEVNCANAILTALSLNTDPRTILKNGINPVEKLGSLQHEDGSFGDINTSVISSIALQSAQVFVGNDTVIYSAKASIAHFLSLINSDGSFGTLYETARVLSYITYFKNDKSVSDAVTSAVKYIKSVQLETGGFEDDSMTTLSAVICALIDADEDLMTNVWYFMTDTVMAKYKNTDGTYRMYPDAEDKFDDSATMGALAVFDSFISSQSATMKLMTHGVYSLSIWENAKGLIIAYIVLLVLALVFWGYILFGRKKVKDKPEGDNYEQNTEDIRKNS